MPFQEPFAQQPLGTARPKIWRAALPLLPLAIRNTTKITEVSASAGGRAAAGKFRAFRGIEALPTLLVCACPHQRPTTQAGGSCGGSEAEPAPTPSHDRINNAEGIAFEEPRSPRCTWLVWGSSRGPARCRELRRSRSEPCSSWFMLRAAASLNFMGK